MNSKKILAVFLSVLMAFPSAQVCAFDVSPQSVKVLINKLNNKLSERFKLAISIGGGAVAIVVVSILCVAKYKRSRVSEYGSYYYIHVEDGEDPLEGHVVIDSYQAFKQRVKEKQLKNGNLV